MHSCIVCSNSSYKTKVDRPEVIYHRFPQDARMRRKWLRVLEIESCEEWHRICSEHFLKEDYKPGKRRFLFPKVCPQPYDQNKPHNDATQINDVETGNNIILPTEQNITGEENFGNAVVNNFISPRRSSRLNRNNEDMMSGQMLDHLGSGLRCSVKNEDGLSPIKKETAKPYIFMFFTVFFLQIVIFFIAYYMGYFDTF